jgi:diphthamide synthase (EF-2-diphthine--ammonia ligase)
VVGLLTTVNATFERVAMHGVRRTLLDAQADALGLPVDVVELPWPCPNETYETLMAAAVGLARSAGVDAVVFGDLFLADIRRYREQMLAGSGLVPLFPLWGQPTDELAGRLLALGVRAVVSCVDLGQLPAELAGRWYDESFLADLPAGVDPCGENGEFHTVVVASPDFARPLDVTVGEIVERDGFAYADVIWNPGRSSAVRPAR